MNLIPYSVWKGRRPRLHLLPPRWCLMAVKKGVRHYLKQNDDDGPLRYHKGPGVHGLSCFRSRKEAETVAARPANRLYHVEEAHKHIALAWFEKLRFNVPATAQQP